MKFKKWISRSLSLLLAATMLGGCAYNQKVINVDEKDMGTENDPLINNTEPITLTVFSQTANWSGKQTGWGAVLLKDMFNVELNIIPDASGAYETRMEKGDLGDIVVWGDNGTEYKQAVDQERLFDWDEDGLLEHYGKDIEKYFTEGLSANQDLNGDGKTYALGNNMASDPSDHDLFIYNWGTRWDLYEKLGKPEVNNLDDLLNVLEQMQELQPKGDDGKTTYAASLWPDWDGNVVMNPKCLAQAYYGYDELGIGLMDPYTGNYYDALGENSPYVEALRFYNRLYQKGLLDPDSMTQTFDQMQAKVQAGNVLFSVQDYAGSNLFNTEAHLAENKLFAPLVPVQARTAVWGLSTVGNERLWSIGSKSVYPEKAMQILNWLYTPDGAMTIRYGIQGLMWDYDENGDMYFTELGKQCNADNKTDLTGVKWTSPYTGKEYTLNGTFNDGQLQFNNTTWAVGANNPDASTEKFSYQTWDSMMGSPKNDAQADWRETTKSITEQECLDQTDYSFIPMANYSESTRSPELDLKWQQVIKELKNGSWQAMYAKSDAEFDEIIARTLANCKGYGYDDCVEWCVQEAQTKFGLMQQALHGVDNN